MDTAEAGQSGEDNNLDTTDDIDAELQALAEVTPMVSVQVKLITLCLLLLSICSVLLCLAVLCAATAVLLLSLCCCCSGWLPLDVVRLPAFAQRQMYVIVGD